MAAVFALAALAALVSWWYVTRERSSIDSTRAAAAHPPDPPPSTVALPTAATAAAPRQSVDSGSTPRPSVAPTTGTAAARPRPTVSRSDTRQVAAPAAPIGIPAGVENVTMPALRALPTASRPNISELVATPGAESAAAPLEITRGDIRALLDTYRRAYERLDAVEASALWPGVDTRALARAFASLSSQTMTFDRCDIDVMDVRASATCHGVIRYTRRVGDAQPQSRAMSWSFDLRQHSGHWRIASVNAR
jgi:hypothetical protein